MKTCIPFWKIKYGSQIAFYGCGNNSKSCYEQLIESGYCRLVCVVDKITEDKYLGNIKAMSMQECLKNSFDYIFITVMNEGIVLEIKAYLNHLGIEKRKILSLNQFPDATSMQFIYDVYEFNEYLNSCFNERKNYAKKPGEYFPELGGLVYNSDVDRLTQVKEMLQFIDNIDIRLIVVCLLYEAEVFDSKCLKIMMDCLKTMSWKDDTAYGIIMDTTYSVFFRPYIHYSEYYIDKNMLLHRLTKYYDIRLAKKRQTKEKKRMLITANMYTPNNKVDAVSMLIKSYAIEFSKAGYEVCIFVLGSSAIVMSDTVYLDRLIGHPVELFVDYNEEEHCRYGIEVKFKYEAHVFERLNRNINEIVLYNPYFILDMSDELFPEADTLINYYPIVYLPMRGNAYSALADAYVFSDIERVKRENKEYKILEEKKLVEIQLGNMGCLEESVLYTREEFGFKNEDFLVITVGSRLQFEISEELIVEMCNMLEIKSSIKWILVGEKVKSNNERFNRKLQTGQIVNWGVEDNLISLYKICNVYLNPDRRGGGVSLRTAMREGIPIIMRNFPSSVLPYMEPSHIIYGDYSDVVNRILEISEDDILYQRICQETKARMNEYSSENDAKKIIKLCEEIANEKYCQI